MKVVMSLKLKTNHCFFVQYVWENYTSFCSLQLCQDTKCWKIFWNCIVLFLQHDSCQFLVITKQIQLTVQIHIYRYTNRYNWHMIHIPFNNLEFPQIGLTEFWYLSVMHKIMLNFCISQYIHVLYNSQSHILRF